MKRIRKSINPNIEQVTFSGGPIRDILAKAVEWLNEEDENGMYTNEFYFIDLTVDYDPQYSEWSVNIYYGG